LQQSRFSINYFTGCTSRRSLLFRDFFYSPLTYDEKNIPAKNNLIKAVADNPERIVLDVLDYPHIFDPCFDPYGIITQWTGQISVDCRMWQMPLKVFKAVIIFAGSYVKRSS